ncbi:hypothetical protein GQ53DRAFT_23961 [Thozetella sp. PMI_491]|nr:hypothetical protein GQ53DRAFT_23961 [Thozetella sp. PMI_491]
MTPYPLGCYSQRSKYPWTRARGLSPGSLSSHFMPRGRGRRHNFDPDLFLLPLVCILCFGRCQYIEAGEILRPNPAV